MQSKILKKGFTLIELLIVVTMLFLLLVIVLMVANPSEQTKKARDNVRFTDIQTLDAAILAYISTNKAYPDLDNTLRKSNTLPSGSTDLNSASGGWINADLSPFTPKLPTDPINDATYYYSFKHTSAGYELNAKLEYFTSSGDNDGGNQAGVYEVGSNLNVI